MQKHRKKKPYKKIAIAVGALTIVGVPTAAMACLNPHNPGHVRAASGQERRPWHSAPTAAPTGLPTAVDTPPASTPPSAPPASAAPAAPVVQTSRIPRQPAKPTTAAPKTPAPQPPKPSTAAPSGAAGEVLALVNHERAAAGCPALTVNAKLTQAAQAHSADMAAHATMSHTGSDGSDPGARITRAGYTWSSYGENVAYGYGTPAQVMEGWMNSPGHRANILNCSFKEIGIGLAEPGHYWTQDFGTAR